MLEKEFIIREEARLQDLRNNLDNENRVLNPNESPLEDREGMQLPPALQGLLDAFMSPFMAIGEAFTTFKDQITSVGEVFAFGFKGLGKGFKKLIGGIKFLGAFFMSGKVLIGLAIAGLVIGLIKVLPLVLVSYGVGLLIEFIFASSIFWIIVSLSSGIFLISSQVSIPSISGIITSKIIRSGRIDLAFFIAFTPFNAVKTSKPLDFKL